MPALKLPNFGSFSIFLHLLYGHLRLFGLYIVLLFDELLEMRLRMLYEEVDLCKGTICLDPTHRTIINLREQCETSQENSLYYFMIKFTQKLPPIHYIKRTTHNATEIDDISFGREGLGRCNTEPLAELLKNMQRNENLTEMQMLKSSQLIQPKSRLLSPLPLQKKSKNLSPLKITNKSSKELLEYRKSIRQLISIFQEQSKEMKSLNINCYHAPASPKKAQFFNDMIIKQAKERRQRLKGVQVKKKLRKSLVRTQGNESPKHDTKRKNVTDLKKILNVNSPYEYLKQKIQQDIPEKSIVTLPQQQPTKQVQKQANLYSKRKQREAKVDRSKRTTMGGWHIDKIETTYPQ